MFNDPTIGLPPTEDELRREPTSFDFWLSRGLNLFGLVSPVANLGMVQWSPKDMRWVGVGAGVFAALVMAYGSWRGDETGLTLAWIAACVHYTLVVLGLLHPKLPELPFRAWMKFGEWLGKVMAVPIFSLMYFLAVTPTALAVRMFGKNPLGLNDPPQDTYWVDREPVAKERYERQF